MESLLRRLPPGLALEVQTRAAVRTAEEMLDEARTKEDKVAALLNASAYLSELRGRPVLQLESGRGHGGAAADDEAAMRWASDQLLRLARQHGVAQEVHDAMLARRHGGGLTWGSGLEGAPLAALACANVDVAAGRACAGEPRHVCPRCRLVAYCSTECAAEHLRTHIADCDSHLAAEPFVPRWVREGRRPAFMTSSAG